MNKVGRGHGRRIQVAGPATGNNFSFCLCLFNISPLQLIQVLLEDKATETTVKLSLPVGQEALVTLKDGQKFVIHISDVPQSSENIFFQGKQC